MIEGLSQSVGRLVMGLKDFEEVTQAKRKYREESRALEVGMLEIGGETTYQRNFNGVRLLN